MPRLPEFDHISPLLSRRTRLNPNPKLAPLAEHRWAAADFVVPDRPVRAHGIACASRDWAQHSDSVDFGKHHITHRQIRLHFQFTKIAGRRLTSSTPDANVRLFIAGGAGA